MKTVNITKFSALDIAEVRMSGKTPWVIILNGGYIQVYEGRAEARKANATIKGQVIKADDVMFNVEADPVAPTADQQHQQNISAALDRDEKAVNERITEPVENKANLAAAPLAPVVVSPTKTKTPKIPLIRESTIERPCKQVWHIASNMLGEILNKLTDQHKEGDNKPMPTEKDALALLRRKDVLATCVASGIAYYTARTQYQMWLTIQNGGTL